MNSWLAFSGSLLTFGSVVIGAWLNLRSNRKIHALASHTVELVNSQHDDLVARTDQLVGALQDADVDVPRNGKGGADASGLVPAKLAATTPHEGDSPE